MRVTAPAVTPPLKDAPPELAMVKLPPPAKELPVMVPPVPALRDKALPPLVTAPMVKPAPAATVLFVARVDVPPSVMLPRLIAVPLVCTMPLMVLALAVLVKPPTKVNTSLPLPNVTPFKLLKVTALVMLLVEPSMETA